MGKMLKKLLVILLFVACSIQANAQFRMRSVLKKKYAETCLMGGFGAYNGPYWGAGANIQYLWGIGRNAQHFRLGFGMREFSFFANKRQYETSDPSIVNKLKNGTDSVYLKSCNTNVINSYLAMQYHIKRGIDFGINIDLAGVTFGVQKTGTFHSYELAPGANIKVNTQPTGFNTCAFLQSNSYGSTVNEAYFQFQAFNLMRFRLGATYFVNQIETVSNPYSASFGNTGKLFKNNNYMVTGGIVWNIRKQKTTADY